MTTAIIIHNVVGITAANTNKLTSSLENEGVLVSIREEGVGMGENNQYRRYECTRFVQTIISMHQLSTLDTNLC